MSFVLICLFSHLLQLNIVCACPFDSFLTGKDKKLCLKVAEKEREHNLKQKIDREEREAEQKKRLQDQRNNVAEPQENTSAQCGRGCRSRKPRELYKCDDPRLAKHNRKLQQKVYMMQ